jgi:hypothetical protein
MQKVFNVGVHRVLNNSIRYTNCWVDFVPGIQIGDRVKIDKDIWIIKDLYTGSTKEEVFLIENAVFGRLLNKGEEYEN